MTYDVSIKERYEDGHEWDDRKLVQARSATSALAQLLPRRNELLAGHGKRVRLSLTAELSQ